MPMKTIFRTFPNYRSDLRYNKTVTCPITTHFTVLTVYLQDVEWFATQKGTPETKTTFLTLGT